MENGISFAALFETRFLSYCEKHRLLESDSLLVALSGGADSIVLLSLLMPLCRQRGIRLGALHVNHQIRGAEAARDAAFCQTFCQEKQIPFALFTIDVPRLAQANKIGLEEAARLARYDALKQYAHKEGYCAIATAHNATDQLETVLFHLIRGSAVHGSGGMAPRFQNLLRPLLFAIKEDIMLYAEEKKLPYVIDSTNANTAYTRNLIRHRILPILREINPRAEEAALRFSESAREDDAFLASLATPYADCDSIAVLASLDNVLLNRVLLIKWRKIAHNEITSTHLALLREHLRQAATGAFCGRLSLPGGLAAVMQKDTLSFIPDTREKKNVAASTTDEALPLSADSDVIFHGRYRVRLIKDDGMPQDKADFTVTIPQMSLQGALFLRTRREGDFYTYRNMTKKVKKLLNEYKIPPEERPHLPLLCDDGGILCIPFLPPSDRICKTSDKAQAVYRVDIYKIDSEKDVTI